jgi:hypothetical protein
MNRHRHTLLLSAGFAAALALGACGSSASQPSALVVDAAAQNAASNPVAVSPEPGTPDASPQTQVSFLGGGATALTAVRAVGSRSGVHMGVLRAYSTGAGESFLPSRPFVAGEHVTVRALLVTGGHTATATTSFTIAHQASVSQAQFPNNPGNPREVQHYLSAPTLTPSTVRLTTPARPGAAPGDLFLAPYQGRGSPGPMISDQQGNLVWFHPLAANLTATNFQVQQYEGHPALTWWQGHILQVGFGEGEDEIFNTAYQHVATIRAGNGYHADLHEIRLTPQGTAWIDIFDPIHMNLASVHGIARGIIEDSVVQEIDVKTGLVMWEWHALGHVPIGDSYNPPQRSQYPWDYIHVNSVDPGSAEDVLLSARNTWSIYDVDLRSGAIRWRIGGHNSSFHLGTGARFYWQHDAEFQPNGEISVFDNGSTPPKERQSRGLVLAVNPSRHAVTLVKAYVHPTKTLLAESQGNTLSLPGGNWLLGYGRLPNFTEFDAGGDVLLDGTLGKNVQNFRTYLAPWSALAPGSPAIAARAGGAGSTSVAISWNGATSVASWRVLAGSSEGALTAVASAPKSGFETIVNVPATGGFLAAQALDSSGAVIATSPTIKG